MKTPFALEAIVHMYIDSCFVNFYKARMKTPTIEVEPATLLQLTGSAVYFIQSNIRLIDKKFLDMF